MERIIVTVEPDLEGLIDGFLVSRQLASEKLQKAIVEHDFQEIKNIGNSLREAGSGCGFDFISIIGTKIEMAGTQKNKLGAEIALDALNWYLGRIRTEVFGEG